MTNKHCTVPCMSNPEIRPHVLYKQAAQIITGWLKHNGGVVVYVPYPEEGSGDNNLFFKPLFTETKETGFPPDYYKWKNGKIEQVQPGVYKILSRAVIERVKDGCPIKYVAIDLIDTELELEGNDIAALFSKAFTVIEDANIP